MKQEGAYNQIKPIEEEPKYIGTNNLQNKGNYPQDEQRINSIEQNNSGIKNSQGQLHQQLEQLLEQSMKLINETYYLKEDNAKLNERIKLIRADNNLRKDDTIKLRLENQNLKEEYDKLNKDIIKLENYLKNKQKSNIKDLEENNRKTQLLQKNDSSSGPIARTTKFEKSQIQTFVGRPTMRPTGQTYQENNDNNDNANLKEKGPF